MVPTPWTATVVVEGGPPSAAAGPRQACATPYPPMTSPSGSGSSSSVTACSPARTRASARSGSEERPIAAW